MASKVSATLVHNIRAQKVSSHAFPSRKGGVATPVAVMTVGFIRTLQDEHVGTLVIDGVGQLVLIHTIRPRLTVFSMD